VPIARSTALLSIRLGMGFRADVTLPAGAHPFLHDVKQRSPPGGTNAPPFRPQVTPVGTGIKRSPGVLAASRRIDLQHPSLILELLGDGRAKVR
jgi:hypothetical protein